MVFGIWLWSNLSEQLLVFWRRKRCWRSVRIPGRIEIIFVEYLLLFQVLKIVGCKWEDQNALDFPFESGACNTFNHPDEKVLLCFDIYTDKQCHTWVFLRILEWFYWISFEVLTVNLINLLNHLHINMALRDWQTIVEKLSPQAVVTRNAVAKLNWWIWIL